MDANTLRRAFTAFFEERGHTSVDSASLIPHHPSAPLFTNSGMMQFVPYFLGEESAPWPRATSIQKCVRLSGKHNDLGELGRTRRHLTFFEMLGNWSFGDYFKEDAIGWAWALLTEHVGFDGDRLWVTVHVDDDEAEAIWHEGVGLPLERIQRLDKENFWEMGPTGPCGPDSEIHFDCGSEWGEEGGPAGGGDDRYIEFWNLVFMSYFRHTDGTLTDLPRHNIDTGGGLERWLMLLQGVPTVFDTDAVRPLIEVAESLSGTTYGADDRSDVALRVVADHARSMAFLVGDGVVPSNEDRGYVVRSVIRRAVTRGQQLGVDRPFLGALVRRTIELLGGAYPELTSGADVVVDTIEREEHRFRQTLATGSALLDVELARGAVAGEVAFKLHDTYGFPIEVTEEMAAERGVAVDRAGFDAAMATQRARGKESRRGGEADLPVEVYRRLAERAGATEFTGREEHETKARVLEVVQAGDGHLEIFLDRTPFYAESGGQVGDTGTITTDTGRAEVLDTTYALPGLHRHVARVVEGEILEGQEAVATIDDERRQAIRRNHTGTHLLHWALRQVLGDHVKQQGSLVGPDYLRFDFSHHGPLTAEELAEVERLANGRILDNEPVRAYQTTMEHARHVARRVMSFDSERQVMHFLREETRKIIPEAF
ncbi:MAG: alanine--tRNA ligase [Actinobacteria bacterium]|nr:alanine--tRNA ligase [Actinomycetota bacterium]